MVAWGDGLPLIRHGYRRATFPLGGRLCTVKNVSLFGVKELTFYALAGIIYAEIHDFQISKSKGGVTVF